MCSKCPGDCSCVDDACGDGAGQCSKCNHYVPVAGEDGTDD